MEVGGGGLGGREEERGGREVERGGGEIEDMVGGREDGGKVLQRRKRIGGELGGGWREWSRLGCGESKRYKVEDLRQDGPCVGRKWAGSEYRFCKISCRFCWLISVYTATVVC